VIGTKTKLNFTPQQRLLDKIAGRFGASFGHAVASGIKGLSMQ
jgi:protease-4